MYIYKLICKDDNITDFYIGSTINELILRYRTHRHSSTRINNKLYNFIQAHGGMINFKLRVIEKCKNISVKELRAKEKMYIDLLKPTLNCNIPTRTLKQWRHDNKEKFNTYMRDYFYKKNLYKKELKFYNIF